MPVEPDGDQGRQLLTDELSKQVYQAAKPTPFDLVSQAISEWFQQLLANAGQAQGAVGLVIVLILITGLIVAAFFIFGRPRLARRSRVAAELFGADDTRGSTELRRSAELAASAGDYTRAIEELYRAVARNLAERTILDVTPGTTAQGFARRAGVPFPTDAGRLATSATDFDDVRYLGRTGTREQYDRLVRLERDLRTARPASLEAAR